MQSSGDGSSGSGTSQVELDAFSELDLRRAILIRKVKKGVKWSWKDYLAVVIALYVVCAIIYPIISSKTEMDGSPTLRKDDLRWLIGGLVLGVPAIAAVLQTYIIGLQKLVLAINAGAIGVANASAKASELQDSLGEDFVTNLVKINFKYIDQYYLQTQQQADRSFSLSMWVSVAGFAIVAVGIALAVFNGGSSAYIATGAGILSEFIAAVFFYLYNQTIASMSNYHRKLVITQNIALALKISEGLPEDQKSATQAALVKTLTSDVNNLLTLEAGLKEKIT